MRRDMNFCIKLLQDFSKGDFQSNFNLRSLEDDYYLYHLELLIDASLIEANFLPLAGGKGLNSCPRITWEGNDFLDLVENETIWNKTKESAKAKGAELLKLPLDIMIAYAKLEANKLLGTNI